MYGIGVVQFGCFDDIVDVQVTFMRSRRPDQAGFVGVHDMFRCTIGFRKDCDGANTHLFARTHDAYGNFSSVGNQNFLNHKILFKLKLTLNDTVRIPIQDNR